MVPRTIGGTYSAALDQPFATLSELPLDLEARGATLRLGRAPVVTRGQVRKPRESHIIALTARPDAQRRPVEKRCSGACRAEACQMAATTGLQLAAALGEFSVDSLGAECEGDGTARRTHTPRAALLAA